MVLARLTGLVLVLLTIVFASLWFYARAVQRQRLELQWNENQGPGRRESFVKAEIARYEPALKRKLIWGVYVVPSVLLVVLIYVTNQR